MISGMQFFRYESPGAVKSFNVSKTEMVGFVRDMQLPDCAIIRFCQAQKATFDEFGQSIVLLGASEEAGPPEHGHTLTLNKIS